MSRAYRWSWFILACVLSAAFLWTQRYEYSACDSDGCVVVDRWTGDLGFREAEEQEAAEAEGTVVLAPRAPRERPARLAARRVRAHPVRLRRPL